MRRAKGRSRSRSKARSRSRSRGTGNRNLSLSNQNAVSSMTARQPVNAAVSGAASTLVITEVNLLPTNLGDRCGAYADMFMYWRLVKFHVRSDIQTGEHTTGGSASTQSKTLAESYFHMLMFVPVSNADYVAPTTSVQLADFPEYAQANGIHPVNIKVRRNGLIGSQMTKWLSCGTTPDAILQSAGTFTYASISPTGVVDSSVATQRMLVEIEVEFKTPMDTALLPIRREHSQLVPNRITSVTDGKVLTIKDEVKFSNKLVVASAPPVEEKKQSVTFSYPVSLPNTGSLFSHWIK